MGGWVRAGGQVGGWRWAGWGWEWGEDRRGVVLVFVCDVVGPYMGIGGVV